MSILRIEHLNKAFGSLVVTDDFNLVLPGGERHVIIGPNGAGKTSLINQIGGQLQPSSGRIFGGCNVENATYGLTVCAERIAIFKAEREGQGLAFDPMQVTVARQLYVAKDKADKEAALVKQAAFTRRTIDVARAPDAKTGSHVLAYADKKGATEENALYGTPDEIGAMLEALQDAGVAYILLTISGGADQLRRFGADPRVEEIADLRQHTRWYDDRLSVRAPPYDDALVPRVIRVNERVEWTGVGNDRPRQRAVSSSSASSSGG